MTPALAALQSSWTTAWRGIGIATADDVLFTALQSRYNEPHRAYHTLQHLAECLTLLEQHVTNAERPAEVALALWFHDAIYDVHAHDNEALSADWARSALLDRGAAQDVADRVHALVMATRHNAPLADRPDPDTALLVDIDLSILGAEPARFAEYEQQIRFEYAHVPAEVFAPRRREILAHFLARTPIYRSPGLRAEREAQAHRNLRAAIGAQVL